mmetsp:Transcript_5852/g.18443  ORF Transcript_5852/g.18443 Transcript_5852/m.18443 type:complete len:263 (-) Transcript_5852:121-909(-)
MHFDGGTPEASQDVAPLAPGLDFTARTCASRVATPPVQWLPRRCQCCLLLLRRLVAEEVPPVLQADLASVVLVHLGKEPPGLSLQLRGNVQDPQAGVPHKSGDDPPEVEVKPPEGLLETPALLCKVPLQALQEVTVGLGLCAGRRAAGEGCAVAVRRAEVPGRRARGGHPIRLGRELGSVLHLLGASARDADEAAEAIASVGNSVPGPAGPGRGGRSGVVVARRERGPGDADPHVLRRHPVGWWLSCTLEMRRAGTSGGARK